MWRFCGQGDERRDGHAYDGLLYWASGGGGADQVEAAAGDAAEVSMRIGIFFSLCFYM